MESVGASVKIYITNSFEYIDDIVEIHLNTFKGFFLTFLGKGFLKQLYKGFIEYEKSNLIIAIEHDKIVGFLAYSEDISLFYKYLIKHRLFSFAWYAFIAFLRKPKVLFRLLSALGKSEEVKREEKYVELASIGVDPNYKAKGVGSQMMSYLKDKIDFNKFAYISLETDADNNDYANRFYQKNKFILARTYSTKYGRKMNEYRFFQKKGK